MIRQSNDMLSGLERELELYMGEEYEQTQEGSSYWIRAQGEEGGTSDIKFTIDSTGKNGSIYMDILSPNAKKQQGALNENVENIVSRTGMDISGVVKRAGVKLADVTIEVVPTGTPSIRLTVVLNNSFLVKKTLEIIAGILKIEAKDINDVYTIVSRSSLTASQEAQGLINFIRTKTGLPALETTDYEYGYRYGRHPTEALELDYEKVEDPPLRAIDIEDLQVGDIIVSTTRWPSSAAIRVLSGSKVSHTVLYIGNGEVVESLQGSGVIRHSVEKAIKDDKYAYALRYPNLSFGARQVIRGFAIKHANLKTRFDFWGMVLRAGLRIPGGGDQRFYCSELALNAYEAAGIQLFETTQKRPGDIDELRGTKLEYCGHIKRTKKQERKLDNAEVEMPYEDHEWELHDSQDDKLDDEMNDDDEMDDDELDDDELDDDELDDDELDDDDEFANELNALEDDSVTENFARRLHELSTQSFESEYELNMELDRALDAVENEYMVKRLRRKHKRGKGKGLFGKILSTGAKIIGKMASATPVGKLIKAGTSLVRGDVKGAVKNLAQAAIGTVAPGVGTVANAAIDALGSGEEGEVSRGGRKRRAMHRVARIARDAYREVADTLPEDFDHPLVAHEVASKAVQKAMVKNGVRPPAKAAAAAAHNRRIIQIRPGEKVVIVRA